MSKKCSIRLFTWTCESATGQTEVVPVCPIHAGSKVRFGRFGTGMIVVCEVGTHLMSLCDTEQFETESEEARRELNSRDGAAST
jgi:hypothetical protein